MIKIHKPFGEKPPKRATHPGNRMEPHYIQMYDDHGHPYLREDGQTDTYEQIQSYKDDTDIHVMLARYAAGDLSVIRPEGTYINVAEMPKSIHEYMNMMQEQEKRWKELPLEVRQKFGQSFEQWAITAGSESWLEKMGLNEKDTARSQAPENKNEQKEADE